VVKVLVVVMEQDTAEAAAVVELVLLVEMVQETVE
jgi:hypothetical protein